MIGQTTHHISKYTVVTDREPAELGRKVETAIHGGWQPWGMIAVGTDEGATLYAQAMVKYADRFG